MKPESRLKRRGCRPAGRPLVKSSLRNRILVYLLCFALFLVGMLWVFQVVYLDRFYERIKTNQIQQAAEFLNDSIALDNVQEVAETLAQRRDICIILYQVDDNGWTFDLTETVSVDILGSCIIHHSGSQGIDSFYQKTVDNGGVYQERIARESFHGSNADTSFWNRLSSTDFRLPDSLIYGQIISSGEQTWFLLLNSTISPVTSTVFTLRVQLAYISIILIVLSVVLSYCIAFGLSRPLSRLTSSAQRLATGDFSVRFDGSGYRETAKLAESLNYAASELGKSEKLQQDILANISHDLRTPLTMIGGYAEMMRDFPDSDYSDSLDVIIDESHRLTRLITDVLDLSRMSAGVQELKMAPFDFSDSLRGLVRNYNLLNGPNGYKVELTMDQDVELVGDQVRLEQAVGNMLNNALTHCGADKLIIVEQKTSKTSVRVTITDHGHGIAADDLPYIWDRYYHADAPQRAGKGSGLGLSIVKGILELHHARFGVESQVGQGCTFWFELDLNLNSALLEAEE